MCPCSTYRYLFSCALFFALLGFPVSFLWAEEFTLNGTLKIKGLGFVPYSLVLDVDFNGVVKGTSFTEPNTPNETKANISGRYNKTDHSMEFTEIGLVDVNPKKYKQSSFCLMSARLSSKLLDGRRIFSGKFSSRDSKTKQPCTDGKIELYDPYKSLDLLFPKHSEKFSPAPKPQTPAYNAPQDSSVLLCDPQNPVQIHCKSTMFYLEVSDFGEYDGDKVLLSLNGQNISPGFIISPVARKYSLPLFQGINTLTAKALNNGRSAPNSVKLLFISEDETRVTIFCNANAGETSSLKIIVD